MSRAGRQFDRLLRRLRLDTREPVGVDNRHVYILPTRFGWLYGALFLALLTGSLNYDNNAGYLLTFLLGALGINAIYLTWRNLVGLQLRLLTPMPVFAGGEATFTLRLSGQGHRSLCLQLGDAQRLIDVDEQPVQVRLQLPALQRGWLDPGELRLSTRYPLGLLRAWALVRITRPVLVYPRPVPDRRRTVGHRVEKPNPVRPNEGNEEWQGLRDFRPGDPLSHIDWKGLARERGLMTKQFEDPAGQDLQRIDWTAYAPADTEQRLEFMTDAVLAAAGSGLPWELILPDRRLGPGRDSRHRERCLEALALFGLTEECKR